MVSETDYQQRYGQAQTAYLEGDLDSAINIVDGIIGDYPEDPSVLLLKGHIFLRLQKYDLAKATYQQVLNLTDHQDLVSLAQQGLAQIEEEEDNFYPSEVESPLFEDDIEEINDDDDGDNWTSSIQFDSIDWDPDDLEEEEVEDPTLQQNPPTNRDFSSPPPKPKSSGQPAVDFKNPFEEEEEEEDTAATFQPNQTELLNSHAEFDGFSDDLLAMNLDESDFNYDEGDEDFNEEGVQDSGAPTFVVSSEEESKLDSESELSDLEKILTSGPFDGIGDFDDDFGDYSSQLEPLSTGTQNSKFPKTESFDDDDGPLVPDGEENFFFAPDELDDIPDIDADELPVSSIFTKEQKQDKSFNSILDDDDNVFDDFDNEITGSFSFDTDKINLEIEDDDLSVSSSLSDISTSSSSTPLTPEVEIPQGKLAQYYNLSLFNKCLVNGAVTGLVTFVMVLFFSFSQASFSPKQQEVKPSAEKKEAPAKPNNQKKTTPPKEVSTVTYPFLNRLLLSLVAGLASGGTTIVLGYVMTNYLKRYLDDLKNQFDLVYQGDYDVKVTVYSEDELGTLATKFNHMAKMISTTTTEARKRAEETEKAREDLQRQVIRLLDDVEGAARGDLTVQAEVTADVLGAVADAFNLTITNLRKIVKQVKQAAIQVHKASADSELYARNQSSDALRMAEELAVTLNLVQMMTDSIQRVAENAREAEEVARSSSVTALKGGDAVERTVAGILQIRETVSETTRKVKRLAEASQQISTIVAVISQIASRTNLLALNASVQAARAGEAGRGFAIVADEVRQLADRSAKSLQEIEQIVLQIQTETGAVMTAMEEGIQQVRDVAERSEQAKRALEDIIQVANRIDALVRSIGADTDEQRENSRGVAKVMQAVELTAQATSQESQRVAGSLQNLVGIAKDLIASVERFKVETK